VSELLCEAVELRPGQQVLDVATGTGNTALAAARRGCEVIGLDWAAPLLARGRERAAAERLPVTFREGEAEQLPFPDASFDAVLSTFGAMYAPDQAQTARELLRVCRSGGKIGLTNLPRRASMRPSPRRLGGISLLPRLGCPPRFCGARKPTAVPSLGRLSPRSR
jgi:ubiquinone/menaquinone biosynthesis C-methylase UbiE